MSSSYCKPPDAYDTLRLGYGQTPRNAVRAPLDEHAERLLSNQPQLQQLLTATAERYPHVINMVASAWGRPADVLSVLDSLILDDRPQRQGFPLAVLLELSELRLRVEASVGGKRPAAQSGPEVPTAQRRLRGFTAVELLITLALVSILYAIATPQVKAMAAAQELRAAAFDLNADLMLARSEAVKRNVPVRVEPMTADWGGGWRVVVSATSQELRRHDTVPVAFVGAPAAAEFGSGGRLAAPHEPIAMLLTSKHFSAAPARCLRVELSGAVRSIEQAC